MTRQHKSRTQNRDSVTQKETERQRQPAHVIRIEIPGARNVAAARTPPEFTVRRPRVRCRPFALAACAPAPCASQNQMPLALLQGSARTLGRSTDCKAILHPQSRACPTHTCAQYISTALALPTRAHSLTAPCHAVTSSLRHGPYSDHRNASAGSCREGARYRRRLQLCL